MILQHPDISFISALSAIFDPKKLLQCLLVKSGPGSASSSPDLQTCQLLPLVLLDGIAYVPPAAFLVVILNGAGFR